MVRCCRAGSDSRTLARKSGSMAPLTTPSPSGKTALISPHGSINMLWPQVRRPFGCSPPCAAAST